MPSVSVAWSITVPAPDGVNGFGVGVGVAVTVAPAVGVAVAFWADVAVPTGYSVTGLPTTAAPSSVGAVSPPLKA